jgi:lantibiotic modifying enzyme
LAAYLHEVTAGRADGVAELEPTLDAAMATLHAIDGSLPRTTGGLMGAPGQIWAWCVLASLLAQPALLDRARLHAAVLRGAVAAQRNPGVIDGLAGAVVPLLVLAELAGEPAWLETASAVGDSLMHLDQRGDSSTQQLHGQAGFATGRCGVGWALARLAAAACHAVTRDRWRAHAEAVFDSLGWWSPPHRISGREATRGSWLTGWAGAGLAALDLYSHTGDPRYQLVATQAALAVSEGGFGWGHTLSHGDPGRWQLLDSYRQAAARGGWPARAGIGGRQKSDVDEQLLRSLSRRAAGGAAAVEEVTPGLYAGIGGAVLTLLRMHPEQEAFDALVLGAGKPGS